MMFSGGRLKKRNAEIPVSCIKCICFLIADGPVLQNYNNRLKKYAYPALLNKLRGFPVQVNITIIMLLQ